MKIATTKLRDTLSIVKPGLSNKEILEQTTSFAFLEGRVVTYNDEISISHPFESDFEGAVKAEELYGLLSKITKDEVELVLNETELLISSGRMKAGLKLETEVSLPLKKLPVKMELLPNPKQFKEFVELAMRTCSVDTSNPKLTCISITKTGTVIGADNYRLIYCKGKELPVQDFLLPARNAVEVVKLNPTHISLEKGWVHFKNEEGTVISCRHLEDAYVAEAMVQTVLKIQAASTIQFPDKIEEMLERVRQFAKRDSILDESVDVTIKDGKIFLDASVDTTGSWIQEKAVIDFEGTVHFQISPSLLRDILTMTHAAILDKSFTKMKFTGKGWEYIIMLKQPSVEKKSVEKKK